MAKGIIIILILTFSLIAQENSIRVLTANYPPFQIYDGKNLGGISTEIVRAILKEARIKSDIQVYPWSRGSMILKNEKNIYFFMLKRTKQWEDNYHWIAPIATSHYYVWKLKKRKDIVVNSVDDLKKYKIGTLPNTVAHNYLLSKGIPESSFSIVSKTKQNFDMLCLGRIDVMHHDDVTFMHLVKKSKYKPEDFEKTIFLEDVSKQSSYFVANMSCSIETVNRLKRAWQKVKSSGEYDKIRAKYTTGK